MTNRKIVPMEINGKTLMVEVEDIDVELPEKVTSRQKNNLRDSAQLTSKSSGDKLIEHIVDIADSLEAIVGTVENGLQKVKPDEWSVEVNMGFSVGGNVFIANGKANSGLKVTAKWVNKDK